MLSFIEVANQCCADIWVQLSIHKCTCMDMIKMPDPDGVTSIHTTIDTHMILVCFIITRLHYTYHLYRHPWTFYEYS